jgi:hypothetical protein
VKPAVEVHIDALVLRGVARSHAARVGEAIERELTRLIDSGGDPGVTTRAVGSPEALGAEIASAIHGRVWR